MDVDPNCTEFCTKVNFEDKGGISNYALIEVPIISSVWSNINYNVCFDFRNDIKAEAWSESPDSKEWDLPQCKLRISLNLMNYSSFRGACFNPSRDYAVHIKLEFTDKSTEFVFNPIDFHAAKYAAFNFYEPTTYNVGHMPNELFLPLLKPAAKTAILTRNNLLKHYYKNIGENDHIYCKGSIRIQPLELHHQFRLCFGPLFEIEDYILDWLSRFFGTMDGLLKHYESINSQSKGKWELHLRCRIGIEMSSNIWKWWWENHGLYQYPLIPERRMTDDIQ